MIPFVFRLYSMLWCFLNQLILSSLWKYRRKKKENAMTFKKSIFSGIKKKVHKRCFSFFFLPMAWIFYLLMSSAHTERKRFGVWLLSSVEKQNKKYYVEQRKCSTDYLQKFISQWIINQSIGIRISMYNCLLTWETNHLNNSVFRFFLF